MPINMSYCMFENTLRAMEEVKERMWEEGFDPDTLNSYERRAYDAMYEVCSSMMNAVEDIEERKEAEEDQRQMDEEDDSTEE